MQIAAEWLWDIELLKLVVAALTLFVGIFGGIVAYKSFRRNEKWKSAEFIAKEMKDFFADEQVRKTKLFIDWGARRIKLDESDTSEEAVTRNLQVKALRPHVVEQDATTQAWRIVPFSETHIQRFEGAEAVIRDCYDRFLDGLETFAAYLESDLITVKSLEPYLCYWIEDIREPNGSSNDSAWRAALFTYVSFYRYKKVILLFKKFGYDISVMSQEYRSLLKKMDDQAYASILAESVKVTYP